MSRVQRPVCCGTCPVGGVLSYPSQQLYEEVAYLALHFHWSRDDLLTLEHPERRRWVEQIGKLHGKD
jgi:hypothetical protein